MTDQQQLEIDIIRTADEFERLSPDWEELSLGGDSGSVFSGWDWQSSWWNQYGRLPGSARELCILVARECETRKTVGILPAYLDRVRIMRTVPVRTISIIGTGGDTSPDYLNPLVRPGFGDTACISLARTLLDLPWNVLSFHDLGPDTAFRDALVKALGDNGIRHSSSPSAEIAWIDLPTDWASYLASLSSNRRYQIRSQRRKFEAAGDTRFYVWQDSTISMRQSIRLSSYT